MAGWKIRKDKTPAETPDAAPEVSAPAEQTASAEATASAEEISEEASPAAESSDWLASGWQTPTEAEPIVLEELQHTESAPIPLAPLPDFEADHDLHFEDEEPPLTLVDYTEPSAPGLSAPDISAPETPAPASVFALPRLEPSAYGSTADADEDDFSHTLRVNREEMAAAFPASILSGGTASDIPTVAPFVLDTPLASPTDEPIHRLVLQVGRLSAPFDITKDVTIIGRPDSALHYYPDVEITIDDAVSRRHAEVLRRDDGCYLTDVGSTNGTLLNGERLAPMEERLLVHGDRIRIGELTEIIFE